MGSEASRRKVPDDSSGQTFFYMLPPNLLTEGDVIILDGGPSFLQHNEVESVKGDRNDPLRSLDDDSDDGPVN
ncbi:unnamed protein product [Haemonchus placei]|uniref:RCK C-terminal domain-containing protein n=1 Tax=Haemonchus placei TaxID=6290 RepID=A0A0N4WKM7_HAEPC|nr:unnamed protein product [Haemonchus placei]